MYNIVDFGRIVIRSSLTSPSGSTLISILDDRIEFVTLGGLVKGVNLSDLRLGISISRNERLAQIFYRLGLIEAYGTGIPNIINAYEHVSPQPTFEATDNAFRTTLPNQNTPAEKRQLTFAEHRILELANKIRPLRRRDVQRELCISQSMAGRILRTMVDKD